MATSSRQSALFGIQDWKRIYQTYREAEFQSYDYETLRKSFIDYLISYYPETFNDFTESSEYVALLDVIAFMGQALAFRNDLNARENFIDTAERRDSVIKLANLVGYTPKRNLSGQGLIKITGISTTENIVDLNGVNLQNVTVLWNDPANSNWQQQFNTVINRALVSSQIVGRPGNSKIILDVKTDEYAINIPIDQLPVISFQADVDSNAMNFELTSVSSVDKDYLYEMPPNMNGQFNILYRNDKLGFASVDTGFFCYFKQGTIQATEFRIQDSIENNSQDVNIQGINNEDVWLYEINDDNTLTLWNKVESVYNILDNNSEQSKNRYSVKSRFNDQITLVFGDGVFSNIPVGNFITYVRSGNGLSYTIDPSEMQNIVVEMNYISRTNNLETLTLTLNLFNVISNAQQRESIAEIKERAPTRFYSQNRMVNGEDYSNFPFTKFGSIIKSKAINRTSVGVSRNQDLSDPTGKYSSTNIFADDGALYTEDVQYVTEFSTLNLNIAIEFLSLTLSAIISRPGSIQYYNKYFPRYPGYYSNAPFNNFIYWETATLNNNEITGYFYILTGESLATADKTPVALGSFSGEVLQYVSGGTMLKFTAPAGYYFDANRQLQFGSPNIALGHTTFLWTAVSKVIGDGYNFGKGKLSNGLGPVRLSSFIPSGAILDPTTGADATAIIPSLDNTLSSAIINDILEYIKLEQSLSLKYDNSIVNAENRWSIVPFGDAEEFISFEFDPIDKKYIVSINNTIYYFGSVTQVRFLFEESKKIFDSKNGKTLKDYVNVLKTNSTPNNNSILGSDYILNIVGQSILSDGFANDFAIEVSTIDQDTGYSFNPEFFESIVPENSAYVFFKILNNTESLFKTQLLDIEDVVTAYSSESEIQVSVFEYPNATIFYAYGENKFFQSNRIYSVDTITFELIDVTEDYIVKTGRYRINFQYRHNSANTSRVDPGTTNIIDLYVVTKDYYTNYTNWINDLTGKLIEPSRPSLTQLQQEYSELNDYKMISDTIVLNSVKFKPLFGKKAEESLRGTIKVIKNQNVSVSDSQIRSLVLSAMNEYFGLNKWDFGDVFYFSELTAYLHSKLAGIISSVVLVSTDPAQSFGDLYEINSAPNEIFVNGATTSDIVVINALTPKALQR